MNAWKFFMLSFRKMKLISPRQMIERLIKQGLWEFDPKPCTMADLEKKPKQQEKGNE